MSQGNIQRIIQLSISTHVCRNLLRKNERSMPFTNSNSSPMSRQDEFIKTVSNEESCKRYECHIGHLFCRFFEASSGSVHYHVARSMRNAVGTRCVSFTHARQRPQGTAVPYTQSTSPFVLSFALFPCSPLFLSR